MSTSKLLLLTPEYDEYSEDQAPTGVKVEETYLGDLINKLSDYELFQHGLVRVKPKDPKKKEPEFDELATTTLKMHGWVHLSTVKDRAERKKFTDKFWIRDRIYSHIRQIDLDKISDHDLSNLAAGCSLMQEVETDSVLTEKDRDKVAKKKKANEKAAAARAAKAKEAAALKEKKKIERAKKILKEAGQLKE